MRWRASLWRAALILAWLGTLVTLVELDPRAVLYAAVGVPLTVLVGAVVDRWWVLAVPALATAVWFVIHYLSDPSCARCGEDDSHSLALFLAIVLFGAPATVALGIGCAARRGTRFFRSLDPS